MLDRDVGFFFLFFCLSFSDREWWCLPQDVLSVLLVEGRMIIVESVESGHLVL